MKRSEKAKALNQIKGKLNHAAGAEFESIILKASDYYRQLGTAEIDKTPEAMRIIKNDGGGTFTAVFTKKSQPDFKGIYQPNYMFVIRPLENPISVIFDAKHTESSRITDSAVSIEQRKVLDRYSYLGAEAFILVSFGYKLYYRIPWSYWTRMKELHGRKYLLPEEIPQFQIKIVNGVLDYLRILGNDEKVFGA